MAAKLAGGGKGKYDLGANSDINVTPFVDILLVLLIVFMVSVPMATVAIKVDLPPAQPPPPDQIKKEPVFISLSEGGKVFIVDQPTALDRLTFDLAARLASPDPKNETVMIRADRTVKYSEFMAVVNQLQTDGYYKVGLISEDLS
jgi:biopolymer transport protein ExbD